MTPVGEAAMDALHSTVTEIFTGAVAAAILHRPSTGGFALRQYAPSPGARRQRSGDDQFGRFKRIFVIALGKAAAPCSPLCWSA